MAYVTIYEHPKFPRLSQAFTKGRYDDALNQLYMGNDFMNLVDGRLEKIHHRLMNDREWDMARYIFSELTHVWQARQSILTEIFSYEAILDAAKQSDDFSPGLNGMNWY